VKLPFWCSREGNGGFISRSPERPEVGKSERQRLKEEIGFKSGRKQQLFFVPGNFQFPGSILSPLAILENSRLPLCEAFGFALSSVFQIFFLSNFSSSRLPDSPSSRLPDFPSSRLPDFPSSRLPDFPSLLSSHLIHIPIKRKPQHPVLLYSIRMQDIQQAF
jgi:hypothetical protein